MGSRRSRLGTDDDDRQDAVTAADHHVYSEYTDTLGTALEECDWTGHPAVTDNGLGASAAAWLDGGLWLHHTIAVADPDMADVLTLLVPCVCGHGYIGQELENERDLLGILADLRRTNGRIPHEGDTGGPYCASIRPAPWPARN